MKLVEIITVEMEVIDQILIRKSALSRCLKIWNKFGQHISYLHASEKQLWNTITLKFSMSLLHPGYWFNLLQRKRGPL